MVRGKLRLAGVFGLVGAMLVSLAMVASAAVGKNKPSAAQYQYKVTICHRTHSKKKPLHTIRVSSRAVPAHLKHGDTLGPCPTTGDAATSTSATSGNGKHGKKGNGNGNDSGGHGNGNGQGNGNGHGKSGGGNG